MLPFERNREYTMETIVLYICGFWFWLTRKFRMESYGEAAATLKAARAYLVRDFAHRASTRDRGGLLPEQTEALAMLERHSRLAKRSARRFESLVECCRFVIEELTGAPPRPVPILLPSRSAFTPVAVRAALTSLLPDTRSGGVEIAPLSQPTPAAGMELPKAA
jgi:hypothetical protein